MAIGNIDKIWVSIINEDSFEGIEINEELNEYIGVLGKHTNLIDCVFDDYEQYRDYEVECSIQARHGSIGTTKINTKEELIKYFKLDNINDLLKDETIINCELEDINGYEIIDYLNKLDILTFEMNNQYIEDDVYCLLFTTQYKDWDTYVSIDGEIYIDKTSIEIISDDRVEEEIYDIEEKLLPWLKSMKFNKNVEEESMKLLEEVYNDMSQISYGDKEQINITIEKLKKVKSYFK